MIQFTKEPRVLSVDGKRLRKCPIVFYNLVIIVAVAAAAVIAGLVRDCTTVRSVTSSPSSNKCAVLSDPSAIRGMTAIPESNSVREHGYIQIQYVGGCAAQNVSLPPAVIEASGSRVLNRTVINVNDLLGCKPPNYMRFTVNYTYDLTEGNCHYSGNGGYILLQPSADRMVVQFIHCAVKARTVVKCFDHTNNNVLGSLESNIQLYNHWRFFDMPLTDVNAACATSNGVRYAILNSTLEDFSRDIDLDANGLETISGVSVHDGQFICDEDVCLSKAIQFGSYLGYAGLVISLVTYFIRWSGCCYLDSNKHSSESIPL